MGPIWGPVGPRWAPCWSHEPCYLGKLFSEQHSEGWVWWDKMSVHHNKCLLDWLSNALRPKQNGKHFQMNHYNESYRILIHISLNFISKSSIDNILSLVQVMAWRQQAPSHYLRWRIYPPLSLNTLWPAYTFYVLSPLSFIQQYGYS